MGYLPQKHKDPESVLDRRDHLVPEKSFLCAILERAYADTFGLVSNMEQRRTAFLWFRSRSKDIGTWLWVAEHLGMTSQDRRAIEISIGKN